MTVLAIEPLPRRRAESPRTYRCATTRGKCRSSHWRLPSTVRRWPHGWASSGWGSWARAWRPTSRAPGSTWSCGTARRRRRASGPRSTGRGRGVAGAGRRAQRRGDHDGRRRRPGGVGAAGRAGRRRGRARRAALHRHVHDRPARGAAHRRAPGRARHRVHGRPRDRLLAEGRGRNAHDHGGRLAGCVRARAPAVRGDGGADRARRRRRARASS